MNTKPLIAVLVALLIGAGSGYAIGQSSTTEDGAQTETHMDGESHSDDDAQSHGDMQFDITAAQAPSAELVVTEDAKSGWNVKIVPANFTFTPEQVNEANVVGEGHTHLYVDGEKIARVYGTDFHYPENFDGEKEFSITFNANDHSEYAVDGESIMVKQTVSHDHSDDESAAHSETEDRMEMMAN